MKSNLCRYHDTNTWTKIALLQYGYFDMLFSIRHGTPPIHSNDSSLSTWSLVGVLRATESFPVAGKMRPSRLSTNDHGLNTKDQSSPFLNKIFMLGLNHEIPDDNGNNHRNQVHKLPERFFIIIIISPLYLSISHQFYFTFFYFRFHPWSSIMYIW